MNDLMILNNPEFGQVRTIVEDGRKLYVGKDIAICLKYAKPQNAVAAHCKGALKRGILTNGGMQEMLVIDRGDVVRLITHSEMPEAQRFESWIFDDMVPTVMETGTYTIPGATSGENDKLLRAQAMLVNAKTRQARLMLDMASDERLSPQAVELLKIEAAQVCTGKIISYRPVVPEGKEYTATEIGQMFGLSANKIGSIANQHGLKTGENGAWVLDKSRHSSKQVKTFRYNDQGVGRFREIIEGGDQ